jgi:hypothetical protein
MTLAVLFALADALGVNAAHLLRPAKPADVQPGAHENAAVASGRRQALGEAAPLDAPARARSWWRSIGRHRQALGEAGARWWHGCGVPDLCRCNRLRPSRNLGG